MAARVKYTREHEWLRLEGDVGVVGITDYAQQQLGDVVFVELPEPGKSLQKGDEAAVVESVKAASEVYSPVSGEVTESNAVLNDEPGTVNSDPTGGGWFFKLKMSDPGEADALMDANDYKQFLSSFT